VISTPVFLGESGDVLVFDSIEYAEHYIEPIDVINNEYVGYDSEGRLLELLVTDGTHVSMRAAECAPNHSDDLRKMLIHFLESMGESLRWLSDASLPEIVAKMMKHKIG
jgi:hypothetical protein